jgi:hypothetical protein
LEREGQHGTRQDGLIGRFRLARALKFAFLEAIEFQRPRIAIDDQHFPRVDLGVEVELLPRFLAGAGDLTAKSGPLRQWVSQFFAGLGAR